MVPEIVPQIAVALLQHVPGGLGAEGAHQPEGGEAALEEILHLLGQVGEQQVEHHGEVDADLAGHVRGRGVHQAGRQADVHEATRHGHGEPDVVLAAPSGPAGHLVKLGGGQGREILAVEAVRIEKENRAGGEIDTGRHGGSGEDRIQQALAHEGFQQQLPGRQLAAVMGPHRQVFQMPELLVVLEVRAGCEQFFRASGQGLLAFGILDAVGPAAVERAAAVGPGLEEENGRQQVVGPQHLEHVAKGRQPPGGADGGLFLLTDQGGDLLVQAGLALGAGGYQGQQRARGGEVEGVEGYRALVFLHQTTGFAPDGRKPFRDFARVADGGRQQQ